MDKAYCFRVNLFAGDYRDIYICSGLPGALDHPYQSITQAIEYIKSHQVFLAESANWNRSEGRYSGRLSGKRVYEYLTKLNACQSDLQDCFMKMGDCFVLDVTDRRRKEVMDGMYRLVAYGLATNLKDDHFPISTYFGTDKILQSGETYQYAAG